MRQVILCFSLALALLAMPGTASADEWLTDMSAATEKAKKARRVILADFTGSDWCGWCIKLKQEVFSTKEFKKWAASHVVLLELDFPRKTKLPETLQKQNEALVKRYGVKGFPTILFLDVEGKVLGKLGYQYGGAKSWIAAAEKILRGEAESKATSRPR